MDLTQSLEYRLEHVSKLYDGRAVVDVESLDIYAGEILAIVGPSGAGKSTLLRLLNFLESPTTGHIWYRQSCADGCRPELAVRRQVTTVFQRPVLLDRSVEANVAYGLQLRGRREVSRHVAAALERVGLSRMARARARSLSGGEAQRVALARALIIEPQVLLLDEPTANLDPHHVGVIEQVVAGVNRERSTTMVLVTHNIFQAKRLAHRVALMLNGQLVEVASNTAFFESPADARTAAFVRGEMVY